MEEEKKTEETAAQAGTKPVRKRKKRAYSPEELYRLRRPKMAFDGQWKKAFGCPPPTGYWIIWGNSGNGKSSFVMQLAKYLCRFGKVFYNSVEEDTEASFIDNVRRCRMEEVGDRFKCAKLTLEELEERMSDPRKEDIYIIDSFQAFKLTSSGPMAYDKLCERHPGRLVIFISRADGRKPKGRPADNCAWDASVKIWVEGFRAYCKGRFTPKTGASFTIWEEGAAMYDQGNHKNIKEQAYENNNE